MTNWIYRKLEPKLWTVGFYSPEGAWETESDHPTPDKASQRVHWLNGGIVAKEKEQSHKALKEFLKTASLSDSLVLLVILNQLKCQIEAK